MGHVHSVPRRELSVSQQIIHEFPPLYSYIADAFRISDRQDVIFSFGPELYNPYGVLISPEVMLHESVHSDRQGRGQDVLDWWERYITDAKFRLEEEVVAHRAEYIWLLTNGNRRERRIASKHIALKLASPIYGPMVTPGMARKLIEEDVNA